MAAYKPPESVMVVVRAHGMYHVPKYQPKNNPHQTAFERDDYGKKLTKILYKTLMAAGYVQESYYRDPDGFHRNYRLPNGEWAQVVVDNRASTTSIFFFPGWRNVK